MDNWQSGLTVAMVRALGGSLRLFEILWELSYGDNGKENGNYYSILGLYVENGKEHGSN